MPSSSSNLSAWLNDRLSVLLGFEGTDEIAQYVLSMEDVDDQKQYLTDMLDPSEAEHDKFVEEFLQRIGAKQPKGVTAYRKKDNQEDYVNTSNSKAKQTPSPVKETVSPAKPGKTKYVSLYSADGAAKDIVTLKGRHPCQCQAAKHKLVNNCTSCGKIVCEQEGSGPCLFCGDLVCTKEELEVLNRNSRKSEQLLNKLLGSKKDNSNSLSKAEQHKNKLLEFDKNCEKRTQVIDDESDYFSVDNNKWLSKKQREALKKREEEIRERRHGSRLNRKITFDFAGRRVVEEEPLADYDPSKDDVVKRIMEEDDRKNKKGSSFEDQVNKVLEEGDVANPFIDVPRPQLMDNNRHGSGKGKPANATKFGRRLQDRELQEMSDDGLCLSMHQPYASLLVLGIKRDEGRTWYSNHRGRLWIHAASKVPSDDEIREVKNFYKNYYGSDDLPFPSSFPTGCLLGCVDVVDVMPQEDYREVYPQGESVSNYVFVCANPKELIVKFPMSGKHKIYKMDSNIHMAAKKASKRGSTE